MKTFFYLFVLFGALSFALAQEEESPVAPPEEESPVIVDPVASATILPFKCNDIVVGRNN